MGGGLIDSLIVVGGIQEDILPTIRGRLPFESFEYWQSLDPDEFVKKNVIRRLLHWNFWYGGWEWLISRKPSLAFQVAENQPLALEYFQNNHLAAIAAANLKISFYHSFPPIHSIAVKCYHLYTHCVTGVEMKEAGMLKQVFLKALGISRYPMLAFFQSPDVYLIT